MLIKKSPRQRSHIFFLASTIVVVLLCSIIPVRIAIALYQAPLPQAILTLGGGSAREEATAKLAKWYPSLEIWVSSGVSPEEAGKIFQSAGISSKRVHLDYRARDTVTNFTTLVADIKKRNFQHLYLITSDFHMPRAQAIAILVLGSRGIAFTPVTIPSNHPPESRSHVLRDVGRALFWIVTGDAGYGLISKLES